MTRLKKLIEKRSCRLKLAYIVPAMFLFLIGLMGFMYGAALFYWPLALVCFSLVFYPTLLAWGIIALTYICGATVYIFAIIRDIIYPSKAGIYSDGIIGPIFVLITVGIAFFVIKSFPERQKNNPNK